MRRGGELLTWQPILAHIAGGFQGALDGPAQMWRIWGALRTRKGGLSAAHEEGMDAGFVGYGGESDHSGDA